MTAWRIDSLDARAGLAFASWREADLDDKDIKLDSGAIFLSPPFFQPEAVTNRALGFSASRGQAQLGVYLGKSEIAFETLDELTEFVRRAYVSGGGGDASGSGGGGGGPPPPPDEPPVFEPSGGKEESYGRDILRPGALQAADQARAISAKLRILPNEPIETEEFDYIEKSMATPLTSVVVEGATQCLIELLRRFPGTNDTVAISRWSQSASALGSALSSLGLWQLILDGPMGDAFDDFARKYVGPIARWPYSLHRFGLPALFGAAPNLPSPDFFYRPSDEVWFEQFRLMWSGGRYDVGDVLDDLNRWPLPADVKTVIDKEAQDPSVYSLMSAVIANPSILSTAVTSRKPSEGAFAMVLFAATHITVQAQPPAHGSWAMPDVQGARLDDIAQRANDWLLRQWPARIFPKDVEKLFQEAAGLAP